MLTMKSFGHSGHLFHLLASLSDDLEADFAEGGAGPLRALSASSVSETARDTLHTGSNSCPATTEVNQDEK